MWNDAVITNAGKNLLAQWANGGVLNISSAAVGEGTATASLLMAQTKLVNKKQNMSILATEKVADGVRIHLQLTSSGVAAEYTINQIGIWAKLDGGSETLVALYQDATGVSVPTFEQMPDYIFTFFATLQMSNEGKLTVSIDTSALASVELLNKEAKARAEADSALEARVKKNETFVNQMGVVIYFNADGRPCYKKIEKSEE